MDTRLSLLMITRNSGELLGDSLESAGGIADEIVIIDDYSTDQTAAVARRYGAKVYERRDDDLGNQRRYGLAKCTGNWILMLDADERLTPGLRKEITDVIHSSSPQNGYYIPYQNHFLGKPIYHGGEDYKIMRLFKAGRSDIPPELIHEHARVTGGTGTLKHKIVHYSYRSIRQLFVKFTDYARRESLRKAKSGETTGLRKLLFYPVHMFIARYIKDKGYKDTPSRIILDIGFAYMEFLTYFFMFFPEKVKKKSQKI